MKNALYTFIILVGLCACQSNSQIVKTATPGSDVPAVSTATPTIFVTPTSSSTPTPIPTNTPNLYSTPFLVPSEQISIENVQKLQELAVFGKGTVNNFGYSGDGQLLALATTRGVYIYDSQTFLEKKYIPTDSSVNSVAFSPDGKVVAATSAKGSVQTWQVSDGMLLDILENNTGFPSGNVLFSPDGSLLFSGSADAAIRAWQVSDGKLLRTFRGNRAYSANDIVNSISISPDGSLLATTDGYERVWIWRVSTGELLHRLEGNHVAFSPDGKILAVSKGHYSDNLDIMLWQVANWTLMRTFKDHEGVGVILSIAFSPDGETIAVNDNWREAKLWNIVDQTVSVCFKCGEKNFEFLLFSPDASAITTGLGRRFTNLEHA
jgi:WD40 repeat protein